MRDALAEALAPAVGRFSIEWRPSPVQAKGKPDPAYPSGIPHVAVPEGSAGACQVTLPYPAPAVGEHRLECLICGRTLRVLAMGRPDDPISALVGCYPMAGRA